MNVLILISLIFLVIYLGIKDVKFNRKLRNAEKIARNKKSCAEHCVTYSEDLKYCCSCDKPLSKEELLYRGEHGKLLHLCHECLKVSGIRYTKQ